MCGRFARKTPAAKLATLFDAILGPQPEPKLKPRYNIAPTQGIYIVRTTAVGRELIEAQWGVIPIWAKTASTLLINARGDTIATKPTFKAAFRARRCIIPADGWYEWFRQGETKTPHYMHARDDAPLALAGIWEEPIDEGERPLTLIVTTEANKVLEHIHDRMPVILPSTMWQAWLTTTTGATDLQAMMMPAPNDLIAEHVVSPRVNSVRIDDPSCIEPVAA